MSDDRRWPRTVVMISLSPRYDSGGSRGWAGSVIGFTPSLFLLLIPESLQRRSKVVKIVEAVEGKNRSCYEAFGSGPCEVCLDAFECELATHQLKSPVKILEIDNAR